ncbi:MAG TPA: uroporphyrinogen decarboxylase family protein [Dehalococcoidales bacterium]|nr:uroporphyrinogen decarboxylase family protein [Dehalococcoidales bacterium]
MEVNWTGLTREQKREKRLAKHLSGEGINFRNAEAKKMYIERLTRTIKARMCQEPDRVPVNLPTGFFPVYYAGGNLKRAMNDYVFLQKSYFKFLEDFYYDMDSFMSPAFIFSAPALEILQYKPYKWPGHGLGDDVSSFQFVEEPYMKADEYDDLIRDSSDFTFRVLIPRSIGCLEPLSKFPPLNSFMGMTMGFAFPFMNPRLREAFQCLMRAGEEMEKRSRYILEFDRFSLESGFPGGGGGMSVAPFDVIADFLRGTTGTILDMYRQPDKLLEAVDVITEQMIARLISNVNAVGGYSVSFPLHKGDDTFMSNKQFEKFYWPSLKKVINALIEEGIIVSLFAEGKYNNRLEYIGDFPKGWVQWQFDQTDMANAKKIVGKTCCIAGNVPASVMLYGTPAEVKEHCRRLIEICGSGGGYILTGGASATEAKPENLRAFMQAAREYGVY